MTTATLKIVFGAAAFSGTSVEETQKTLQLLEELGISNVDVAELYGHGEAEANLGKANAAARFNVDTKCSIGFGPEQMTKDAVIAHAKASLERLATKQVDVYYLHAPDRTVPLERTLEGVDIVYRAGGFRRFGLSNYLPQEVEEVIRICKERGFVVPSVYQGNYSPVARRPDLELLPILRKHNIAFYAYSPLAGGFLTKTRDVLVGGLGKGRWDPNSEMGRLYGTLYNRPNYLNALDQWEKIAEGEGVSKAELATRWATFNSYLQADKGDAIIFGGYNEAHIRETVGWFTKGPLSAGTAKKIDGVWDLVKDEAIWDNYNNFGEKNRYKAEYWTRDSS